MVTARGLAIAHFVFGVIYSVASLTLSPDSAGPIVLLVILPLAATLTAFYVWTLNSLSLTMKELAERKQNVKALMYKKLWWVLLGSVIVIFVFFFFNSLTFAGHGTPNFAPSHWRTRWFVLDGWLNLVYLIDLAIIAYVWRPTRDNMRFAMSDQLAQDDDDGFEIASVGGVESDDEDDLEVGRRRDGESSQQQGPTLQQAQYSQVAGPSGSASAGPARRSEREVPVDQEGEAMFSVGGEGDGESDDEEEEDDYESWSGGSAGKQTERLTGR